MASNNFISCHNSAYFAIFGEEETSMIKEIIGRENEIKILKRLLHSTDPELLALYGRRRVGKTFLIKQYYQPHLVFSCSGQYNGNTQEQLLNFTEQLNSFFPVKKKLAYSNHMAGSFYQIAELFR